MESPNPDRVDDIAAARGLHEDVRRAERKFAILVVIVTLLSLAFFVTPLRTYLSEESFDMWRAWATDRGFVAPALFTFVLAASAVAGIPRMYPTILGGALFGVPIAMALSIVGSTIGAIATFAFARKMGKDFVDRKATGRVERILGLVERQGFAIVVLLRMVPFSNFVVTNYVCGISTIRARDYAFATALGMVPSTLMFVMLGQGIVDHSLWLLVSALVLFAALTVIAAATFKRILASDARRESEATP